MLYLDGITPGLELDANNQRKFTAFYFSFEEFGVEALQSTDAWLPLAVQVKPLTGVETNMRTRLLVDRQSYDHRKTIVRPS